MWILRWPYNAITLLAFLVTANAFVLYAGWRLAQIRDRIDELRATRERTISEHADQLVDELEKELGA